ncbi:MAG: hypothetical protein A3E85_05090 [Gammaproteobacteria bacterium RIFCSPHIGHO2_12_FULL_45_12]|nr:MAG: hypothetical protein A3E85_05090 [Gammaproteobacteria bacterium RIFCSPHIGHO2_12_FULL_45_12]
MNKLVIIFGYNNTRVYDIERLKKLCTTLLDAEIMLCKEEITQIDKDLTQNTLKIDLAAYDRESLAQQAKQIDNYLASKNFTIVACLPFSDKGIPLGSLYAKLKNLPHDDTEKSIACIDKHIFRCLEKEASTPDWYKKPFFKKIHTLNEARECTLNATAPLFFKPVAEGNSRGCIEINSIKDLEENIDIINLYLKQGVLIEECIKGCDEYSFDGVDGNYIVTEKKTSQGYYRVETQHILPAPLENKLYERLIEAGKIVSEISGSNNGAVHNELFLNKATGDVYCVEPNRRPAGLKLWDWINTAYPTVDNWNAWINWAAGKDNLDKLDDRKYFVGCRMLQSQVSGTIKKIHQNILEKLQQMSDVCDVSITKKIGQPVTNNLKDNSDFTGYIVCKSTTINGLRLSLDQIEKEAINIYTIE